MHNPPIKAAQREFEEFSEDVRSEMLSALTIAAEGSKSDKAKPFNVSMLANQQHGWHTLQTLTRREEGFISCNSVLNAMTYLVLPNAMPLNYPRFNPLFWLSVL